VEIVTETAYPFDSTVTVRVNPARAERFSLRLRVPSWSARTSIEPGRAVVTTPPEPGNYAVLSAKWQRGDSVKLRLDLRGRVERDSSGGSVCVRRGPLVLARDSRLEAAGGVVDDALLQLKCDADGYIELTPVSPGAAGPFNFVCDVPALGDPAGRDSGPELSLRLCDYASAGGWGTGARFRVWLPLILDPSQPDFRP
ncbi:glycoside hydrolase family 127 protein, partial [bacterium]|nr:glycoside hydrolase family 127 protein [bacterium]